MENNNRLGDMMKKLALLGAARPRYQDRVKDVFNNRKCDRHCWTGWSYKIDPTKLRILDEQWKKEKYFHIYYHDIENPSDERYGEGTGYVDYCLIVKDYQYKEELYLSPEPECTSSIDQNKPHRLYAYVIDDPIKIQRKKWNEFIDFDTGRSFLGPYPWKFRNAMFKYIIDPQI